MGGGGERIKEREGRERVKERKKEKEREEFICENGFRFWPSYLA